MVTYRAALRALLTFYLLHYSTYTAKLIRRTTDHAGFDYIECQKVRTYAVGNCVSL